MCVWGEKLRSRKESNRKESEMLAAQRLMQRAGLPRAAVRSLSSVAAFGHSEFRPFTLKKKETVNHDSAIYHFDFEEPTTPSGLQVVSQSAAH